LVPESPEEITTQGGLDVVLYAEKIGEISGNLRSAGLNVSIFIDPENDQIKACHRLGLNIIELNTGSYAENWNNSYRELELDKIKKAVIYAKKLNFTVLAGHGLTYQNVSEIAAISGIEELNIGHSIIANATLIGLENAVKKMKDLLHVKW